jgi:hypothetical protein
MATYHYRALGLLLVVLILIGFAFVRIDEVNHRTSRPKFKQAPIDIRPISTPAPRVRPVYQMWA